MNFCPECGTQNEEGAKFCKCCGKPIDLPARTIITEQPRSHKKKSTATLWCLFLGEFGAHKFYLGQTTQAIIMLICGTLGAFLVVPLLAMCIWALVELVKLILLSDKEFETQYNKVV